MYIYVCMYVCIYMYVCMEESKAPDEPRVISEICPYVLYKRALSVQPRPHFPIIISNLCALLEIVIYGGLYFLH